MNRRMFILATVGAVLAACGRKAPLRPPEGVQSTYPQAYPRGAPQNEDEDRLQ